MQYLEEIETDNEISDNNELHVIDDSMIKKKKKEDMNNTSKIKIEDAEEEQ